MIWKKIAAAIVIPALTIGMVACSSGKTQQASDAKQGAGGNSDGNGKKITITTIDYRYAGNVPPANGRGIQMINEKFNVDFKPTIVVQSDYMQKLSATVASGELPDIITLEGADANYFKWAKQGAFLPLNDYISQYPSFKLVPEPILKSVSVDGKIYGLPRYYPLNYSLTPVIRKDWLDNLGLKMPTNYEELKQVAIAFTKNDPDKNGKNDTYGLAMSQNINPQYAMGAYWDVTAWYHKNAAGQLIPGYISKERKEVIAWLADLFKEGAVTPDFAVMNWTQTNKEFYSGKAGIFIGAARGMVESYAQGLLEVNPGAKIEPIPPFKAPDGTEGFTSGTGMYGVTMLNANLAKDPEKLKRILEILDFGRKFYPFEERNSSNKDYDWLYGNEGTGYTIENGTIKRESAEKGLSPADYLPDAVMWAPSDEANAYSKTYKVPLLAEEAAKIEKMHAETKHYLNPVNMVFSETRMAKESELNKYLAEEQTKMIYGQRPVDDWDKLVQEWMDKGGAQIVKEVNDAIAASGVKGEWK